MSRRKMFLRMITASLLRRRSRMLVALLSIAIGAAILSGLVTVYYDVPRQMQAEFRSYGANMLLVPAEGEKLSVEKAAEALHLIPSGQLVGQTPYRYVSVQMMRNQQTFVAAGTDFDQVRTTSPYFTVEGDYPSGARQILIGKAVADTIGAKTGSVVELSFHPQSTESTETAELKPGATLAGSAVGFNQNPVYVSFSLDEEMKIRDFTVDVSSQTEEYGGQCGEEFFTRQFTGASLPLTLGEDIDAVSGATITSTAVVEAVNGARPTENAAAVTGNTLNLQVTGVLETGGKEENYIFMSLDDLGVLTGEKDSIDVMELSVSAGAEELNSYVDALNEADNGVTARLVKRITNSETAVLDKLQALVFLVTAVVLLLTMICVSTTMMAVVTERRKEIGLRKALGASDGSIRTEFLGEGMFLGMLGGLLGALLGFGFAQIISVNVFGGSITLQPLLVPITMIVSMIISALSCMLPIKHAIAIDPALVLKGE
ncbi:MAG: ABC transporter permease [Clostridia bacterium]|nr:ABC transporter permease [Clostridia bacterium]